MQQWRRSPGRTHGRPGGGRRRLILAAHAWQAVITGSTSTTITGVWLTLADVSPTACSRPDRSRRLRRHSCFSFRRRSAPWCGGAPPVARVAVSLASGSCSPGPPPVPLAAGLPSTWRLGSAKPQPNSQFVQQTLRDQGDVLAAALVWGLAWLLPAFGTSGRSAGRCAPRYAAGRDDEPRPCAGRRGARARVSGEPAPQPGGDGGHWRRPHARARVIRQRRPRDRVVAGERSPDQPGEARNLVPALVSEALKPSRAFCDAKPPRLARAVAGAVNGALMLLPAAFGATSVVLSSPGTIYEPARQCAACLCSKWVGARPVPSLAHATRRPSSSWRRDRPRAA